MQTRHRQIVFVLFSYYVQDFAEIDSGSFQSQEKEKTVKIPKKQTKRTLKSNISITNSRIEKEKNTAKDSIENVSEDKIHLLLELNSFNQNEKEGYSEKEKCLAVSCFLKVGGGFLLSVAKNASYYYSECIDNGITPVRHLQMYMCCLLLNIEVDYEEKRRLVSHHSILLQQHLFLWGQMIQTIHSRLEKEPSHLPFSPLWNYPNRHSLRLLLILTLSSLQTCLSL